MPLKNLEVHYAGKPMTHHSIMWWMGKWDAPVYAALVAVGVPLMGWAIHDYYTKLHIAVVWFAFSHVYWHIELSELLAEVRKNGLLKIDERNRQKNTMQLLYWGAFIAIVVWGLFWAGGASGPSYGPFEWGLIIHTAVIGALTIGDIYPIIDNYLQATAGQKRFEEEDEGRKR